MQNSSKKVIFLLLTMKFGKYLSENLITQWKEYYIHYKAIKKFIAMAETQGDKGISSSDAQYFVDKVEDNVRRVEKWFLEVRNACFERFELVQTNLPKEIRSHLPCISEFTSFQQYEVRKNNKDRKRSKDKRHKRKRRKTADSVESSIQNNDKKSRSKSMGTSSSTKSENVRDRVHVIDVQHNDEQQVLLNNNEYIKDNENAMDSVQTPVSSSEDDYDENSENEANSHSDDDQKYQHNKYEAEDDESFNEKYLVRDIDGEYVRPPTTLFIENAVFSHLPPSAHRECLSILLTLGKLKLFAWQNS